MGNKTFTICSLYRNELEGMYLEVVLGGSGWGGLCLVKSGSLVGLLRRKRGLLV